MPKASRRSSKHVATGQFGQFGLQYRAPQATARMGIRQQQPMVATVQFKSCPESLSQNTKHELMSEHLCPMLMEHVGTFIQCEGSRSAGSCQTQAAGILNGAAGESKFLVQAFSCSIDQLRPFSAYCSNARPSGGGVHRAKNFLLEPTVGCALHMGKPSKKVVHVSGGKLTQAAKCSLLPTLSYKMKT